MMHYKIILLQSVTFTHTNKNDDKYSGLHIIIRLSKINVTFCSLNDALESDMTIVSICKYIHMYVINGSYKDQAF